MEVVLGRIFCNIRENGSIAREPSNVHMLCNVGNWIIHCSCACNKFYTVGAKFWFS
jgi:hypothetical protein